MKKNLLVLLSFVSILLAGCSISNNQATKIDSEKWLSENGISIEETFNNQIEDFQYINDFENFVSYNILSITEDKPFTSDSSITVKFNKDSAIQGGMDFSQKKISKTHDLESSDIVFNIQAEEKKDDYEPLNLSGNLSLLYKDNEVYAKLHNLGLFMGEGNVLAKMYTLLGDLITDNWVDLGVHSGGVITIDEEINKKLPYITGTIENIIKTEDVKSSPNFLGSVVELIDIVNSYINLGISTDELTLLNYEISYFELSDKTIQKEFTGSFQGKKSSFDLSFISSKKGLIVHLYNIKEYDDYSSDFKNIDSEFMLTLKENKRSEYSVEFTSLKSQQKIVELQGKINYADNVGFFADFIIGPIESLSGQKISGKLNGNIIKKLGNGDEIIPELTGNILSLNELLSSL